jgi:hypothetical protein
MELTEHQDYRIKGYFKEKSYDANGDVVKVEFFKSYNSETSEYSNLKVREIRTVVRDETTGIPNTLTVVITWHKSDGSVFATKTLMKPINGYDGQRMNQEARTILVTQAQGYLLQTIGLINTQEFGTDLMSEREAYIAGTRQPLLDAINNSARVYVTAEIKAALVLILDVAY